MGNFNLVAEDSELQQLFEEVRRYPLLSADQELEADRRKWRAAAQLQVELASDASGRAFLVRWLEACLQSPPDVEGMGSRELFFTLRRELSDMAGDEAVTACLARLQGRQERERDADALAALQMPATMAVALAEVAMSAGNAAVPEGVAAAIDRWQSLWPGAALPLRVGDDTASVLQQQIRCYLESRDKLVSHNLRLVCSIAGNHTGQGLSYPDLVQEGVLGLIRAAEKFRYEKGYRFSTYAYNWIAQAIRRGLRDTAETIRYPGHVQEKLARIYGERARRMALNGETPGDSELAEATGLDPDLVRQLLQLRNRGLSLDTPRFDDDEGGGLIDEMSGGPFRSTVSDAEHLSLRRLLMRRLEKLDPSEKQVVIGRWGLDRQRPLTRAEIADKLSVSREWIRQLERSALDKLSRDSRVYAAYLDHDESWQS